jgi:hypothetical protein
MLFQQFVGNIKQRESNKLKIHHKEKVKKRNTQVMQ